MAFNNAILLAGNPNVGKSSLFNRLTGLNQHTGNWPGKTVAVARGNVSWRGKEYRLVDLPGCYSLAAASPEEEIAAQAVLEGGYGALCLVCDASSLIRSLPLVFQAMEATSRVVVCLNLMDEARARNIRIDPSALEKELGLPVVCVSARKKEGLDQLMEKLDGLCRGEKTHPVPTRYAPAVERALDIRTRRDQEPGARLRALIRLKNYPRLESSAAASLYLRAEASVKEAVTRGEDKTFARRLKWDKLLTGRGTSLFFMALLTSLVFYLTIRAGNYPSALLSGFLFGLGEKISRWMLEMGAPLWLEGMVMGGVWQVTAWVVSVMLPPMAIFFFLFSLLEDVGYLPRVAFNLDNAFRRCRACGKQALTMLMGFGCNAVGVTGCRIIDSPRERMIAILTNALVPCNGRFPLLILLVSLIGVPAAGAGFAPALGLTFLLFIAVGVTLGASRMLSATVLKGMPSAFALELPPFRRPQAGALLVRSFLDRTLYVLGRAAAAAAPAGLILWGLNRITWQGLSLSARLVALLEGPGWLLGMDGVMLAAFILALPANELVLPIALMLYQSAGQLISPGSTLEVGKVLAANGWTYLTALCAMLFTLFHWPCATTLLTVRRETGSWRWTLGAALLPTMIGALLCSAVAAMARWLL